MKTIKVKLGKRSYPILIGDRIIPFLGRHLKKINLGNTAVIITNPVVRRLFFDRLSQTLEKTGIEWRWIEIPDSETSKSRSVAFKVINRIAAMDVNRKIFLIALGGGVVGDLTGFVASIYKRGIGYIQIPTTLLAQIDSSIGGKVAIDLTYGKNLVGAFYQPRLVLSDIAFLKSLGRRDLCSGMAEAIKYGMIQDNRLFSFIEKRYKDLLALKAEALMQVVQRCSCIKAKIVEQDEKEEKGLRTILNFGHTIGHAVEAASGYKAITHGEAIAFGMVCASQIASHLNLFPLSALLRLANLITKFHLPIKVKKLNPEKVLRALKHDKKFVAGKNRFVLPVGIGRVKVVEGVPLELVRKVLHERSK